MSDRLEGLAVITGAGSGIGKETARLFASRGARLVLVDRDAEALSALSGSDFAGAIAATLAADVGDPAMPGQLAALLRPHGAPRYLVNNAGIAAAPPILETQDSDIERFLSVNVASVFRLCRTLIPMMQGGDAAIVNVSSVFGLTGVSGVSIYSLTKGAVAALTVQLATEFGRDGIRVNAVAPGLIHTPLTDARIRSGARAQKHMIDEAPIGRAGTPADVAEAIAFLCSGRASFITGEILKIDGGWMNARLPRQ
ncbi:SDR family NAD(P)-dependent oxidoreductase [Zhengella mangrovi]|nr:SDR family oxidoreductase [Zhengella mangrovi]